MRASAAHQRALLELQAFDTHLAKLAHERRNLPVLTTLKDLADHRQRLDEDRVRLGARLGDEKRELSRVETDVEQVRARSARHQERLASGIPAREAQALQAEVDHLAGRTGVLEDEQLVVMERVETTEDELGNVGQALEDLSGRTEAAESERDTAFARIDAESEGIRERREARAAELPPELVALYERVREQTGGIGVVELFGERTEPLELNLPLSEVSQIRAAAEDQVMVSEEHGHIIVRP
ncbi:MAG: hypothetical protein Q4G64_03235 [bacterium]|nr:hypothetical protein [bacterium]